MADKKTKTDTKKSVALAERIAPLLDKALDHVPIIVEKIKEIPSVILSKDKNQRHKRGQMITIIIAFGIAAFLFIFLRSGSDDIYVAPNDNISLTRIDGVEAEDQWIETAETRVAEIDEKYTIITQQNAELLAKNKALEESNADLVTRLENDLKHYEDRFRELEAETTLALQNYQPSTQASPQGQGEDQPFTNDTNDPFSAASTPSPLGGGILPTNQVLPSLVRFELSERTVSDITAPSTPEGLDPNEWLPAGSFAPGVVISGADAKTGVSSQSDPRPVVVRITGPAVSASGNSGKTTETDLTGCTITGEARGDLSSERVYVRILRMTCLDPDTALLAEVDVKGYIAGGGQAGVRGPVISREGTFVQQAFLAGALSGFGSTAATALNPPTPAILDGDVTRETSTEAFTRAGKSGFAAGIGTAGEKLADYYIERAEQYQPVVSLKGGTVIEVVFIEGAWLDGRKIEE